MARLTQKQKTKLVELVTKHYKNLYVHPDIECRKQTWVMIASKLNNKLMKRDPDAWRKSMNDIKRQVKIKLAKIQAHHSENVADGSSVEAMTDLDLKVEALFSRDLLQLKIEPIPIEPNQTIPVSRHESAKDVCSNSEPSDELFVRRDTPLQELLAESVRIQKECLNVLKDIRNQNSDVVNLLDILHEQITERNDMRGSQDFLEEITSSVKERQCAFNAIRNGVPSNCKTSSPKQRPKSTSSAVGPVCKIAKISQMPDMQLLSSTQILQPSQIETTTPVHTETNNHRQLKQQQPNLKQLPSCMQPVQLQEPPQHNLPSQQKLVLPILRQKQLILQPPHPLRLDQQQPLEHKVLFQLSRQQKLQPRLRSVQIQSNNSLRSLREAICC